MGPLLLSRALAATLLLVLPAGLAAAQDADAPAAALAPLEVALGALPDAVRLAILEADEQLRSDQAQRRLDLAYDYVQGFGALPAGQGALSDPGTRAAYAWVEQVVETFLGLPAQFDVLETAGATCRSYGQNATAQQVEEAVRQGRDGAATLQVLRAEMARLASGVPAQLDRAPFDEAVRLLDDWRATEGAAVADCIATLPAPSDPARLFAVAVPAQTFRTGHARILGQVQGAASVTAASSGLGLDAAAQASNGTFRIPFSVPRSASLGNHSIRVAAAGLQADVPFRVTKAALDLHVQAPSRVVANTTFTVRITASSPAGGTEVDRAPVSLAWRADPAPLTLAGGSAQRALPAGAPGSFRLVVESPGTDVLAPATVEVPIEVFVPGSASAGSAPANAFGVSSTWFWWLLVLLGGLAVALGLFMMPVVIHRLRGARGQALRGDPAPPRWPGAASFIAAVAALFDLLRRRRLAPPGQTFREWLLATGGPTIIADRFDAVRYGDVPEDEDLRKTGLAWSQRAWDRWRAR